MEQELVKIIKHRIFDYVESHLKYYVPREDLKKEKQKLYSALKDLFDNVPIEEMGNIDRFSENKRFDFLLCKCRKSWGTKFLCEINDIIITRITN